MLVTILLRKHFGKPRESIKMTWTGFLFIAICTGSMCNKKCIASHQMDLDDHLLVEFRVNLCEREEYNEDS
jgi:hypothetical protein